MKKRALAVGAVVVVTLIALPILESSAEPILKARKYHGPIPKRYFSLGVGFVAGPDNEQMWDFLDRQIPQPQQRYTDTSDFGAGFHADGVYTVKLHPQFAFRGKGSVAFLSSESAGLTTGSEPDTSGYRPELAYKRSFDVLLLSTEASALYYFQDASIDEFQTYIGAGLGLYFPYAKFQEDLTNTDSGQPVPGNEADKFTVEPSVHTLLGFLYHIRPTWSLYTEGRFFMAQSKFTLDLPTEAGIQPLTFDVDYTGFTIVVGASKYF